MSKQFLNKTWIRFALFNFLLYTVVFLTRIIRDSVLFSTDHGAWLFAVVLSINAIIMTYVGGRLDKALENPEKISSIARNSFLSSSIFFLIWGFWGVYNYTPSLGNDIITAMFYLLSEIPIFLAINLIWIMTSDFFTDQQGQKYFPRISGFGLLGVSFASFILLQKNVILPDFLIEKAPYIFLIVLGGFFLIVLWIASWVQQSHRLSSTDEGLDFKFDDDFIEKQSGFWNQTKENYLWIKKIPFLKYFALVTVCNFILLAIFDNNLANVSIHLNMAPDALLNIISRWVFFFGLIAAIFQLFLFSPLLAKIGIKNMNMFAPSAMFIGVMACFIFASPFFMSDNVKTLLQEFNIEQEAYLLNILLFARICGWIAEFLFNQSMLPLLYNSLPASQVNRGRFFIEGPLTAITNGIVGIFLLFYFWFFKEQNSLSGTNLAILYIIALVASFLMYLWSRKMKPEFRKIVDRRISEDEINIDSFLDADSLKGKDNLSTLTNISLSNNLKHDKNLIRLLILQGTKSEESIKKILFSENRYGIKKELITGLISISALEIFSKYISVLDSSPTPDEDEPLDVLVEAAQHFGLTSVLNQVFKKWLEHKNSPDFSLTPNLLYHLSKSGIDGALFVKEYLENYLSSDINKFSERAQVKTLIKIRSAEYFPQLADLFRNNKDLTIDVKWTQIADIDYTSHAQVLSSFSLMLHNIDTPSSYAFKGAKKLIKQYPWLLWLVLVLIETGKKNSYKLENQGLCFIPLLIIDTKDLVSFSTANILFDAEEKLDNKTALELLSLFNNASTELDGLSLTNLTQSLINSIKTNFNSVHLSQINFLRNCLSTEGLFVLQPELSLNIAEVLYSLGKDGIKTEILNDNIQVTVAEELFKKHLSLLSQYENYKCPEAENWLYKRTRQYFTLFITLIACNDVEIVFKKSPELLVEQLLSKEHENRDRAFSRLQLDFSSKDFLNIKGTIEAYFIQDTSKIFNRNESLEQNTILSCKNWAYEIQKQLDDHLLYHSIQEVDLNGA